MVNHAIYVYILFMYYHRYAEQYLFMRYTLYYYVLNAKFKTLAKRILYNIIIDFIRIRRNSSLPPHRPTGSKPNLLCPEQTSRLGCINIRRRVATAMYAQHNIIYDIRIDQLTTDAWKQIIFSIETARTIRYFN